MCAYIHINYIFITDRNVIWCKFMEKSSFMKRNNVLITLCAGTSSFCHKMFLKKKPYRFVVAQFSAPTFFLDYLPMRAFNFDMAF